MLAKMHEVRKQAAACQAILATLASAGQGATTVDTAFQKTSESVCV